MRFLLVLSFISASLFGQSTIVDYDEIGIVEALIETTSRNLAQQQKLLESLIEFKQARAAFVAEPTSAKLATKLVKNAMSLYEKIEQNHCLHLFPPHFIEEINFFNQVGQKKGLGL